MATPVLHKPTPSAQTGIKATGSSSSGKTSMDVFFQTRRGIVLICVLLFGLVVWTFWPALSGQFFIHDENGNLLLNKCVNTGLTWGHVVWAITALDYEQWTPLTWISHMADFQFYGANPWGHHLTNVLLHAASTVLLFLVLKKMTGAFWRSLVVTGMFAFHPLRVESVAWISERKDVLSVFFGFLALWAYAEYSNRTKSKGGKSGLFYGLTISFFALSLLSKQTLTCFPCILLLLDYWPLNRWGRSNIRGLILEKIPFFIVIPFVSKLSYLALLRGGSLYAMAYLDWGARFENALISYARYLGKFFFPVNLHPFYSHPEYWPGNYVFMAGALVVTISALAWLMRRELPYFFVGWFWFFGTLVQVIGFLQLYAIAMADRYSYVPSIGLGLFLVWGFYALAKRWRYLAVTGWMVSAVLLLVCIALTRHQIRFWKDEITFMNRVVVTDKDDYVTHYILGSDLLLYSSEPDRAISELQKSVEINPHYYQAQQDLGDCLLRRGRFTEAIMHFQAALDYNPYDSAIPSMYGLAMAYHKKGKLDEAIFLCQEALSRNTNDLQSLTMLVTIMAQKGRWAEAVPLAKRICKLNTNDSNAFGILGFVLIKDGQLDEAISAFQNALRLAPDSTALQDNLTAAINAKQQAAAQSPTNFPSTNRPSSN